MKLQFLHTHIIQSGASKFSLLYINIYINKLYKIGQRNFNNNNKLNKTYVFAAPPK